jgi:hypothetical protein
MKIPEANRAQLQLLSPFTTQHRGQQVDIATKMRFDEISLVLERKTKLEWSVFRGNRIKLGEQRENRPTYRPVIFVPYSPKLLLDFNAPNSALVQGVVAGITKLNDRLSPVTTIVQLQEPIVRVQISSPVLEEPWEEANAFLVLYRLQSHSA